MSTSGVVDEIEWDESGTVDVGEVPCPISDQALQRLQQTVDPLSDSPELGIDLYMFLNNSYQSIYTWWLKVYNYTLRMLIAFDYFLNNFLVTF